MEIDQKRMRALMHKAISKNLTAYEKQELKRLHEGYMKELAKNPLPVIKAGYTENNQPKKFKIPR